MAQNTTHSIAMGLLADDKEWHQTLEEADLWTFGQ
jgi:hypothetical protein